jgi:hypothetical protein
MRRHLLRTVALVIVIVVAVGVIGPVRRAALKGAGRLLVTADDVGGADVLAMDVESGPAGALKVSDLYRAQPNATVALLMPSATRLHDELKRRGVVLPNLILEILVQLGVPNAAVIQIPAGEGGTTETTAALASWARAHPDKQVLVVVGPSHGRRFRRALRRSWPDGQRPAAVVTTPYALFRADDWWQSRTTVREGLVELEKLGLDYARHPW